MSTESTDTHDSNRSAAEAAGTNGSPTDDAPPNRAPNSGAAPNAESQGDEAEAGDRLQALTAEIEALEQEREEINERLLRKAAEFENYRRRAEREKRRRFTAGKIDAIEPILDVLDDFERSLAAASDMEEKQDAEAAYESLRGGVEMVFRKFQDALEAVGVEPIDAEGQPFDESLHEAMMRQPAPGDAEPGDVLQVIRKGYTLGDRVLRHSRVIVAAAPDDQG